MPSENTGKEVSFEWSHCWISSTDSKVIATKLALIIHSGSRRVRKKIIHLVTNLSVNFIMIMVLIKYILQQN